MGGMGGGGGGRSWGGMGGAQGGASGAAQGGIPVDDELIEAIAESMREQGFPVEPDRLKMMLTRGGGMLTPPMIERMEQMGMGIKGILENLGKKVQPPADEPAPSSVADPMRLEIDSEYVKLRESIDFSAYADVDLLEDGSAKKDLRELEDKLLQTEDEREFAQIELDGIRRLAERDFATKKELDRKEITLRSRQIQFEAAGINQGLYIKYEFPKQAERLLSDYEEALMKLERTVKTAYARLSQKEARRKSAERRRGIEGDKVNDLREQMENCVILAEREGLVVYGSSGGGGMMYRGGGSQEPIDEGTTVRERQLIITIPDMNLMGVSVKVHESAVQMVKKGQRVTMTVDARPEQVLEGEVMKVSVLPDSNNFFFNPDLKVYPTTIQIEGVHEWLRPGMSAQVQIRIKTLEDVLYVPIQAVSSIGEERVCYVVENGKPKRRLVEIGSFTEEFVEIVSGLEEGDVVLLRAPDPSQREEIEDSDAEEAPAREVAATEASKATAS